MKFDKNDAHLLFSAPAAGEPDGAARMRVGRPAQGGPGDEMMDSCGHPFRAVAANKPPEKQDAALQQVLRAVVPALFRKISLGSMSRRERRERLLQLVSWFCQKRGYDFRENVKQPYLFRHAKVDGRLQAVVSRNSEQVALETCFELDGAALAKLRNAYLQGKRPLLLWLGTPASATELLSRASQIAGVPAGPWLDLVVLSAGNAQSPK